MSTSKLFYVFWSDPPHHCYMVSLRISKSRCVFKSDTACHGHKVILSISKRLCMFQSNATFHGWRWVLNISVRFFVFQSDQVRHSWRSILHFWDKRTLPPKGSCVPGGISQGSDLLGKLVFCPKLVFKISDFAYFKFVVSISTMIVRICALNR